MTEEHTSPRKKAVETAETKDKKVKTSRKRQENQQILFVSFYHCIIGLYIIPLDRDWFLSER